MTAELFGATVNLRGVQRSIVDLERNPDFLVWDTGGGRRRQMAYEAISGLSVGSESFGTTDVQVANDYISDHVAPHRLSIKSRSELSLHCRRWHLGDFRVCEFSYGQCEVEVRLSDAGERGYFVVVPMAGQAKVSFEGREHILVPGMAMAFTTESVNTTFRDSSGFRNLNISVSDEALRNYLLADSAFPTVRGITFVHEPVEVATEVQFLLDYVRWFASQTDHHGGEMLKNNPHVAQHIHSTLMSLLVSSFKNNNERELSGPVTPVYVRLAEEYIRTHAGNPITVDGLAKEVRVGTRTLQLGFRRYRNCSVSDYIRNVRLSMARKSLATAWERNLSVTDVAISCGFLHLSRFALTYKRRFGEKPSDTLKRGRI